MNSLLVKNKPEDISKEEFIKLWENASYTLEALYKTIDQMAPPVRISPEDFDKPAFTHKMIWAQAQADFADKVLALFPKTLTSK